MRSLCRFILFICIAMCLAACAAKPASAPVVVSPEAAAIDGFYTLDTQGIRPTSMTMLMYLRREDRPTYDRIPAELIATIICDDLLFLWDGTEYGGLGKAPGWRGMDVLVEVGEHARPYLIWVLYDRTPVNMIRSAGEINAQAYANKYRRCDFAYKAICLIDRKPYHFSSDPAERDKLIVELLAREEK